MVVLGFCVFLSCVGRQFCLACSLICWGVSPVGFRVLLVSLGLFVRCLGCPCVCLVCVFSVLWLCLSLGRGVLFGFVL